MISCLQYPFFNSFSFMETAVTRNCSCSGGVGSIIYSFAFNKLPESPVITPSTSKQIVRPSAFNKYLAQVTVLPIPTTPTP